MQLVTYQDNNGIYVGALREDGVVSLAAVAPDMLSLIDAGPAALEQARTISATGPVIPLNTVRLLAPIPRPRQNVVCVGMNYVEHARESDRLFGREHKLPEYPVFFSKAVTAVCGPNEPFVLDPSVTQALDYEVELAIVIGRSGKNIPVSEALNYVFGYTIANDLSARDLQIQHQQFFKGKSLDGSCPLGPCILTADEVPDPAALGLRMRVNGETRQDSIVSDLIFDVPSVIAILSRGTTVEAGTIIATGTPSGVGIGRVPPRYLQPGDIMEAEIDRIGVLRTAVVSIAEIENK